MIEFLATDPQKLLTEAVGRFEEKAGETLFPGDERYEFLAQQVQLVVACREEINHTANRNLLRFADGEILNEYGRQFDVTRLPARYASVMLEFRLMAPLTFDVPIANGVRVTPDGQLQFLVSTPAVIPAGETAVQVSANAEYAGENYNGFLPDQIKSIVDPIANVNSVANVTASTGGADEETDDSYRERIRLSWEGISTCGSKEGYEYWARTASAEIVDVEAVSNADSEITLYILLEDAAVPSRSLLDAVSAAVSAEKRRPLTDKVQVQGAVTKRYNIKLAYYVSRSDATDEMKIKSAVEKAITAFAAEQKQYLGGDINPDTLRREILRAGGYRMDITEPVYTELLPQEVAIAGTVTVTYGGML